MDSKHYYLFDEWGFETEKGGFGFNYSMSNILTQANLTYLPIGHAMSNEKIFDIILPRRDHGYCKMVFKDNKTLLYDENHRKYRLCHFQHTKTKLPVFPRLHPFRTYKTLTSVTEMTSTMFGNISIVFADNTTMQWRTADYSEERNLDILRPTGVSMWSVMLMGLVFMAVAMKAMKLI